MADDDASKLITKAAVGAAGAAAGAYLTTNSIVSGALGAALAGSVELALYACGTLRARRTLAWWERFVKVLGTLTAEGGVTEAKLWAAAENDPEFQERIHHVLSAVWSATDECVLPCLAFLAAEYEAAGKPADALYKRVARLLQDTTAEELTAARGLIAVLATLFATHTDALNVYFSRKDELVRIRAAASSDDREPLSSFTSGRELRLFLKRSVDQYLVDESTLWDHSVSVVLTREQFAVLQRYLAAPLD